MEAYRTIDDKYVLLRPIGSGGMADVWLAASISVQGFKKLVVIKQILPHLADKPKVVDMFLQEARIAAGLQYANIVTVYDVGTYDGVPFIAMEYLHGESLLQIQQRTSFLRKVKIPLGVALHVCIDIGRALAYSHSRKTNIVHRDVSPHNIVVTYEGTSKLVDFGVAKSEERTADTATGVVKGKFGYMSPEQAAGEDVDARTDQFSLGVVMFELTTGTRLYKRVEGRNELQAIIEADIVQPSTRVEDYPAELERIVVRALARNADDRFPTVQALVEEIEGFLAKNELPHSDVIVGNYMKELFADAYQDMADLAAPYFDLIEDSIAPELTPARQKKESTDTTRAVIPIDEKTNLRRPAASFVGRRESLRELGQLFGARQRLVTLLGPPGTGKTRLAKRYGEKMLDYYSDENRGGVWICDLTEARTIHGILGAIVGSLGIEVTSKAEDIAESYEEFGNALAGWGETLIIFDGFEHIVPFAPEVVGRFLTLAPEARFLVTSRERLSLDEESVVELAPLALPKSLAEAEASEAVQLFIDRARTVRTDFELDAENKKTVAEIVRRLDGIPLAIELAAARLRVLQPDDLLERLEHRFDVLTDTKTRRATLRDAIGWSWELLHPWEQAALAQCSIFRGGFSLAAAEQVLDLSDFPDAPWVTDIVQALCDKSLLRTYAPPELPGEIRFGLYESIREFARESLPFEKSQVLRARHGEYYLSVGTRWATGVNKHGGKSRLKHIEVELENLVEVHRWGLEQATTEGAEIALRSILVMDPLLSLRGPTIGYVELINRALAHDQHHTVGPLLLSRVLQARGNVREIHARLQEGLDDLKQALALARRLDNRLQEARVLIDVGRLQQGLDDVDRGRRTLREALKLGRQHADKDTEARALYTLALVEDRIDDHVNSTRHMHQALGMFRELGDRRREARVLANLADFYWIQSGEPQQARKFYRTVMGMLADLHDRSGETRVLSNLGLVEQELGNFEQAEAHLKRAAKMSRELGHTRSVALCRAYLGALYHETGRFLDALRLYVDGINFLSSTPHRRFEALFIGFLGGLHARMGDVKDAERAFQKAEEMLSELQGSLFMKSVEVTRGQLDVANGDIESARKRIAVARAKGPATKSYPEGSPSAASLSDDVRLAIRLLEAAIASRAG